ncbi:MAG: proliferating cell nuclear antigen (pcna) [Aigarchaeota archaeon]|nr:proliferating cell nuclear antigen (pcna) [Aigarchaeota archaeon]MCX8192383.1 proliferating cell nuclear antigen (pcna) [Nitrososphaeria archaeon]MDW7986948.1 proliferating cell nuclear antigen (pcna) [Nitrososphaerota archaeon]
MSFKMRLPSADYFSDLMKAVQAVVDEGTFKITEEGIRLIAMDPAHISLIDFELSNSAAEEYECSKELQMTISISEMMKFLRRIKKGEGLTIIYDDQARKLNIILVDATSSRERIFTLNTLETVEARSTTPKLTFDAKARLNVDAVKDAIKDSDVVSDYVKIILNPNEVIFLARGELGTVQTKLSKMGAAVYEIETDKEVWANFSLSYLDKIVKAGADLSEEVVISLSTNKPIKLGFPIPSGKLEYLIAPRIEST